MPGIQVKKQPKKYDAVIVGSGAGGGMATYVLANAGLKVCLLEAGPMYDPKTDSNQLKNPWESPRRGASTKFRPFGDFDGAYWGWEIDGEPYTHAEGTKWEWWRSRMLGGRTNHWGRISLRFGPKDFKRKSIDGLGDDWPIGYEDVKPYYDKIDKLLGVFGTNEGLENDPDGIFLPPPKPRLHELFLKKAATSIGVPVIPSRLSILTKQINKERGQCFYCAQCGRSCKVYADFSSSSALVIPVLKTGNVDLVTNAMAREVLTNKEGLATGVSYVDKTNLQEYQVEGRTVILAASTCETARLLLNSKSQRHPNGLANSGNVVGKYLHDSTGAAVGGVLPQLFGRKRYNEDGVGGMHVYTPWWLDNKKLDFPRGYHIEYWGGMEQPAYGFGWGIEGENEKFKVNGKTKEAGGYGKSLKEDYRYFYGVTWGDDGPENDYGLSNPGNIIHEAGTVRMGNDPKTSALDKWGRAHDCKNLFCTDGSVLVSQADKNITWTILALSMRTSEYIVDEMKKQNI